MVSETHPTVVVKPLPGKVSNSSTPRVVVYTATNGITSVNGSTTK